MARNTGIDWDPHDSETRPWRQSFRAGERADRQMSEVAVSLPPHISRRSPRLSPAAVASMEDGVREIVALDHVYAPDLRALGTLLLRTESVASSKIEYVEASIDDYARALYGVKANFSASSMVAATEALAALIGSVEGGARLDVKALLRAHHALMGDDRGERDYAGRFRDMQNWIGGSNYSPRNALYVPPPPETVDSYMDDLVRFANRDDLPVLAQAAIAHAQFESVHPFTDGNGRIGRALINTILRRRSITKAVVVPLASALVARRDDYFAVLDAYRAGHVEPIIRSFSKASLIAAAESRTTAERVAALPELWQEQVGPVRAKSAAARLLDQLTVQPVFASEQAEEMVGGPTSSVYSAIKRLAEAGVLRPLTDRKRNQVWGVGAMLDELDDLGARIALRARVGMN